MAGVCKSSFCPFDIDQKKAPKKPKAINRLTPIIKKITFICGIIKGFIYTKLEEFGGKKYERNQWKYWCLSG